MEGMAAQGAEGGSEGFAERVKLAKEFASGEHISVIIQIIYGHAISICDNVSGMTKKERDLPVPPPAYQAWAAQLGRAGWLCQGTVVSRSLRRRIQGRWVDKGPYYMWTCKVAGKTVCQAVSRDQYLVLQRVIAANRRIEQTLDRMRALTLKTILKNMPGVKSRKSL
jgi:hypothetical protein